MMKKEIATEKKDVEKKTVKKMKVKIVVQYLGNEIEPNILLEQAKADYLASGGNEKDMTNMELYIKPEDNAAYYVVNGITAGKLTIFA